MMTQKRGEGGFYNVEKELPSELEKLSVGRPSVVQSYSDPTSLRVPGLTADSWKDNSSAESRDMIVEPPSYGYLSPHNHLRHPNLHRPYNAPQHSPASSRPSSPYSTSRLSRPSLASSVTSATVSVDVHPELKDSEPSTRRPSILTRLRSSVYVHGAARSAIHPSDFQNPSEQPEKHFIHSIGMVVLGVCNRQQCVHPLAHFVSNWRLCEPIEYTTALADHGITYSDYSRLIAALAGFLDDIPSEPKQRGHVPSWWQPRHKASKSSYESETDADGPSPPPVHRSSSVAESERQYNMDKQQAESLNKLLEEITWNWRKRGLPVMVCISSYSLFAPNRISESHVQILHAPHISSTYPDANNDTRDPTRLSFIDPFTVAKREECSVARPRSSLKRRSVSPHSPLSNGSHLHHHQLQFRGRTRPWPLWPNAIPSRKREHMNDNADRYGVDPYFRAWMRADINSRTRCTSYAKYMIERENNPFINKRLEYVTAPVSEARLLGLFGSSSGESVKRSQGNVNRKYYEHNRRLECRKTIEHGSRLRIVRFGFRHPMYPPHTPEMDELGLTRETYYAIVNEIENIRLNTKPNCYECVPNFLTKIGHRSPVDAMNKVSEYIRHINAASRRVVWTIEKIPSAYDQGVRNDEQDWEISAWNGEDPLELLIQLEKWGIIEKKLNIDDDD